MAMPEWNKYIECVLAHVKFKYDHYDIKEELLEHMEDMYDGFLSEEMEEDAASRLVVDFMGNPDEIGEELNKEHRPLLGWMWRISRAALIIIMALNIIPAINLVLITGSGLIDGYDNKYAERENTELVYSMDVDKNWKINNKHFWIKELRYYDNGVMEVRYALFENPFSDSVKWNSGIGSFYDEYGNRYFGTGSQGGGYYSRGQSFLKDFPPDADKLIYDYEYGGRKVYIEIPLNNGKEGGE